MRPALVLHPSHVLLEKKGEMLPSPEQWRQCHCAQNIPLVGFCYLEGSELKIRTTGCHSVVSPTFESAF